MNRALHAYADGLLRALRAPAILTGAFLVTWLLAWPASHLVRADLAGRLGHSEAAGRMADGIDLEWWNLYQEEATGLGRSFTTTIIGFAAVIDGPSRLLDAAHLPPPVAALVAGTLLVWLFLSGGILDRLARRRPVRAAAFFSVCGVFFLRFLRLGIIALAGYALLFGPLHRLLFEDLYPAAIRDLTVERTAFAIRLALYLVFGALLVAWTTLIDYAKVRAVVEDRSSMLGAFLAGSRFALRHPLKVGLLWLLNSGAVLIAAALYALVAPGVQDPAGVAILTLALGQIFVLVRLVLKLAYAAAQIALFQSMQAHAAYTAAPLPIWPESPEVEAIRNAASPHGPAASDGASAV